MERTGKLEEKIAQLLEERNGLLSENNRLKNQVEEVEKENAAQKDTITSQDELILTLQSQLEYLKRRLYGASSERHINNNLFCHDLFDNRELTEAEKQETEAAIKEIESYLEKTIQVKVKEKPVRKPLPDSLPRREEHHYPEMENEEAYDELPSEITEILEHEPGKCYVRKIIRHKYVLKTPKSDVITPVITAPMPALPLLCSYAGATLLSELMIRKG